MAYFNMTILSMFQKEINFVSSLLVPSINS